jgi:hypothetical protein
MNTSSRNAGIPVLTEIIPAPAADSIPPAKTLPSRSAPETQYSAEMFESKVLSHWTSEEWYRLERKIRERILRKVLGRIDSVIEQQVRDHLADVLQIAVEGLATDIKRRLQRSMEQVVARAVSEEVTRLQTTKK